MRVPGLSSSGTSSIGDPAILSKRRARLLAVLIGLGTWGLFLLYYEVRFGLDHPPAASGDEPDYDSLGWELSKGNGFQVDTGDPDFRRPYDFAARQDALYELGPPRSGPITTRPPLFPLIIAGTNLVAGRQFWVIRYVNAGAVAVVMGLLAYLVGLHRGLPWACVAAILFVLVDTRTRLYGRTILTEPLAMLLITVLCLFTTALRHRPTAARSLGLGVLLGLLVLSRTMFILWLPAITLCSVLPFQSSEPRTPRSVAICLSVFLLAFGIVISPWGIRNCLLLGRMMPLGTQGASQMSAAFSDSVWDSGGGWRNIEAEGFYAGHLTDGMTLVERELAMADLSQSRGREWIRENPGKTLLLFPMKIVDEVRPRSCREGLLLILALAGIPFAWAIPEARVGAAFWLLNCFGIGMTWSMEGRFLVPLLFVQHLFAAFGLAGIVTKGRELVRRSPPQAAADSEALEMRDVTG